MLWKISQLTWLEIMMASRHGLGTEKINSTSIDAVIPSHITEDVTFLAFRFHDKAPMVGYREGEIFHIVWIDPKRKVYKH
jgi:hypothetical protein